MVQDLPSGLRLVGRKRHPLTPLPLGPVLGGETPAPIHLSVRCPEQSTHHTAQCSGLGWTSNSKTKQKHYPLTLGKIPNPRINNIRIYWFLPETRISVLLKCVLQTSVTLRTLCCQSARIHTENEHKCLETFVAIRSQCNIFITFYKSAHLQKIGNFKNLSVAMDSFKNTALPQFSKGKSHFTPCSIKRIMWHFLSCTVYRVSFNLLALKKTYRRDSQKGKDWNNWSHKQIEVFHYYLVK